MKKKLLTAILVIGLFCNNIAPAFAMENIMLSENNADMTVLKSEDKKEITENINDVVKEKTVSKNEIIIEEEITEEIVSFENDAVEEMIVEEKDKFSSGEGNLKKIVSENNIFTKEEMVSANSLKDGMEEKQLTLKIEGNVVGNFSIWEDVIDTIKKNADNTKEYIVEIYDDIFLEENLTIPSGIGNLIIKGIAQNKKVVFSYIGDIKLFSNLAFESIELKAKKYNSETKEYDEYTSSIILNGKKLNIRNSEMEFASIKGNSKSLLNISNSKVCIEKAISGVGYMELDSSVLKAQTITITSDLLMKSAVLESEGKITLKNVISNNEKNKIIFQDNEKEKLLNITGTISSATSEEDENVLWKSAVDEVETLEIVKVRKNAVTLQVNSLEENGYEKGALLANIPKAGASWFVIGSEWQQENEKMVRVVKEITHKVNTKLYCGNANDNVVLFSSREENETGFVMESCFATLQEALNEIDKIGDASKYYRILLNNSKPDAATFINKSIKFPSKTKGLLIRKSSKIEEGNLYFKGNLNLKCNVKFEDIIFRNNGKSNISLGKYVLYLKNCYSNHNSEMTEFYSITGNGTGKNSGIILEDTILKANGVINNIGQIHFLDTAEEEVTTYSAEEIMRIVPAYPELRVNGKINIGDVILDADGKITGIAKITRKKGIITKITPDMNIEGKIISKQCKNLFLELQEKTENSYKMIDLSVSELEEWKQEKGIPVIKAFYSKYPNIYLFQNNQCPLIKKAGYFTYYETKEGIGGVELSFESEGKKEKINCYSLMDAMTEINHQKVKRDYIITLKKETEDNSLKFPQNIKFPTKKYINSLVIQGEENQEENVKLGYLGNLNFTSPIVIKNISFVQMMKKEGEYRSVKEIKEDYPGIVTIKTGGFDLEFRGKTDFDTPIKIDGGNKGNLILSGMLNTYTNEFEKNVVKGENVIYGMFTNFNTLSLEYQKVSLREAGNGKNTKKYIVSNNKIANLCLKDESILEIIGVTNKNSLNAQNVFLENSEIIVKGNGKFKDVTLTGEREAVIYVDKTFNITGRLEIDTDNGSLKTRRKGKGKEPYLNISGKVYLEEGRNPLYVGVYYEIGADEFLKERLVDLRNTKNVSAQLLTAKYAAKDNFRPMEENYPGGEYSETNTNGYQLVKKGNKIYVYAGESK